MEVAVIDLETVPAPWWMEKQEEERAELIEKRLDMGLSTELDEEDDPVKKFAPLPAHLPVVYGCWQVSLVRGEPLSYVECTRSGQPDDMTWERPALVELGQVIETSNYVVTYNGRGFDMPLMQLRALAKAAPWKFWERMRHRYPNYRKPLGHVDLLDQLTDYGGGRMMKLDDIASMINHTKPGTVAGKGDMDGSMVAEVMKQPGGLERTTKYCNDDVKMTTQIFLRWLYCCSQGRMEDVVAWLEQLSVTSTPAVRYIYRYIRADMEEIDQGPYATEAEAQAASDKHATFGATTSGAVKIDMEYELRIETE